MNDLEQMRRLHERFITGEKLSNAEKSALKSWYEANDEEENDLLNASEYESSSDLRENLSKVTRQIARIGSEIETLVSQNAKLRKENNTLRRSIETSLLEKAA